MTTVKSLSRNELRLWSAFESFSEAVLSRVSQDVAQATGLSGADYRVLSRLVDLGDGVLRQRELALAVGWDKSRVSHQLTRMEERNLVTRTKTPEHGSRIAITPFGRNALAKARPIHALAVRRHLLQRLTPELTATILTLPETSTV